ncbi:hypothetical protein ANN_08278 [Periplaneta americana]|uniref:Uncharacterized protein n=1 Tax=Periplaneta americana TaxID=6978 RepID=A0ABQ8T0Y7_PERAM|nr:hypothetical protein ANN_08278 [Periplaneta americana]
MEGGHIRAAPALANSARPRVPNPVRARGLNGFSEAYRIKNDSRLVGNTHNLHVREDAATSRRKCSPFIMVTTEGFIDNYGSYSDVIKEIYVTSTGFLNMCSHNVVSTGCNKSPLCILRYFKMNDEIDNPADCEVRSVIRFLNALHLKPAEIYRQLKEVYGDTVMN